MLAYVNLIQKKEKEIGCDVLTHQKWSGASYIDRVLNGAFPSIPICFSDLQLTRRVVFCSCVGWLVSYRRVGQGLDRGNVSLADYIVTILHLLPFCREVS